MSAAMLRPCRALALAALLVSALEPAASLPAEAPRSGAGIMAPTTAADPPASSTTLVTAASAPAAGCDAQSMLADPGTGGATDAACVAPDLERDQAYLVETARPGDTMLHQGPALAVVRLHPTFVRRLAGAISEARAAGLPAAGIYSAYRPPAFGVGGFADKFNSLHAYGLAVDMLGIGRPGSDEARLWYEIVARHGIVCPYGAGNRREWNHCQPTSVKSVIAGNPLRGTISPPGPVDLEAMFAMGDTLVYETDAGAGSPELQPASDAKLLSRPQEPPRAQVFVGRRADLIVTGHGRAMHRQMKPVAKPLVDHSLHEAHAQSKRRVIVENVSAKIGPVKKYRIASLVKRESVATKPNRASSKDHAPANKRLADNAHLDRTIKGVCRGC